MEPRNATYRESPCRLPLLGGRAEPPEGLVGRSHRGQRTGHRHTRVPQEPERSGRLHVDRWWRGTATSKVPGPRPASGRVGETNTGARDGIAKRRTTKRGERGGRKSEHLIVPSSRGTHLRGPWPGKGVPSSRTRDQETRRGHRTSNFVSPQRSRIAQQDVKP